MTGDLETRPGGSVERTPERVKRDLTEAADWVAISVIATLMYAVPFALRFAFSENASEHGTRNVLGWLLAAVSLAAGLGGIGFSFAVLRGRASRDPRAQQRAEAAWPALLRCLGVGAACFFAWWVLLAA